MVSKTTAQQRQDAKIAYNAFFASCPSRQLLDLVSDKWVCLVLSALSEGTKRYGELNRQIVGVSQKMLTQTLRALERDGIVKRTLTPTVPVRSDYELTALGHSLAPVMQAIKDWAEANMDDVLQSRRDADARQPAPVGM